MAELPKVHEESSLECTFHTTFLLPAGEVGDEFFEALYRSFAVEADGAERGFVLVPYDGDRKTAIVTLRRVGPSEALEHLRLRSMGGRCASRAESLPETCDEMAALSTALVYVTHGPAHGLEQQLGPICASESSYRSSPGHQPCRFVAALQPSAQSPGAAAGGDVGRELQACRVGPLPVLTVERGDLSSHRRLLVRVVEALAQHFSEEPPQTAGPVQEPPLARKSGGGLLSTRGGCWGSCTSLPTAVVRY